MSRPKGLRKTGGRLPGVENKITAPLRKQINDFLNDNWTQVQSDFKTLEPKERLQFYDKMLSYAISKPVPEQPEEVKNTPADWYAEKAKELMKKVD